MKKFIFLLLFSICSFGQKYERNMYIFEKVLLDESPENHSAINQCPIMVDYEKVLISSKSNPRVYLLSEYADSEATLDDGLTYKIIKAKKITITYEGMKLENRTYRIRITLMDGTEANYELVEIITEVKN